MILTPAAVRDAILTVLNDLDPDTAAPEYVRALKLSPRRSRELLSRLRLEIARARKRGVPLGVETLNSSSLEDAYLVRQRYLGALSRRLEAYQTAGTLLCLVLGAVLAAILALISFQLG